MFGYPWRLACIVLGLLGWISTLTTSSAHAQLAPQTTRDDAPLVVDGVVRQIYTGDDRRDHLVEIEVQRSEARRQASGQSRFPAPAETVYVHVSPQTASGRISGADAKRRIPEAGQSVRAYLKPRSSGGWQDAFATWFDVNSEEAGDPADSDSARGDATRESGAQTVLGMTIESLQVENQVALRVVSVARGSPAQTAGLEVGDTLVAINGSEIKTADELTALSALGEPFSLDVVDVNSGRVARIQIDPASKSQDPTAADKPAEPAPPTVSLGMSAESVTLGTRSAIKVIRVEPTGLAAKAGLEPGDIVVAANGVPTTSVEQLLSALRKSGSTLNLTVRDTRTGRDTAVALELGVREPMPPQAETSSAPVNSDLGAVTELAFHDNDFAVKITEVAPNGAAARAGLRPGTIIVAADDKPMLHPNDLIDLARKSRGTLKLTVVNPASGKKSNVEVNLKR
jgi:S1-C subfamily serine protease